MTGQASLAASFAAAEYRIDGLGQHTTVIIGRRPPRRLADWLATHSARRGWIVTAHNPRGRLLAPAQNRRRAAALARRVDRLNAARLSTRAVDPARDWPDEPGFLLAGVSAVTAHRVGAGLGQAALVELPRCRPARLRWL